MKFQASSSFLCLYKPVCVGPVWKPHCWFSHKAAHVIINTNLDFSLLLFNAPVISYSHVGTSYVFTIRLLLSGHAIPMCCHISPPNLTKVLICSPAYKHAFYYVSLLCNDYDRFSCTHRVDLTEIRFNTPGSISG